MVLGIVGVIYGVWARTHPQTTALDIQIRQRELAIPNDPKLEITYGGTRLARPTLVEITVQHVAGPEIPQADVPSDGIRITADKPAIVGGLLDADNDATLDEAAGAIQVHPYLVRKWATLRLLYLAEGEASYTSHLRIANVGEPGRPLHKRRRLIAIWLVASLALSVTLIWTTAPTSLFDSPISTIFGIAVYFVISAWLLSKVIDVASEITSFRRRRAIKRAVNNSDPLQHSETDGAGRG
jgi:hypothetical protein